MCKRSLLLIWVLMAFITGMAQSSYIQPGVKDEYLLQQMEIKTRSSKLRLSQIRPMLIRDAVHDIEQLDSLIRTNDSVGNKFSKVDRYNIQSLLMHYPEWSKYRESYASKKRLFNTFYHNKSIAVEINKPDFYLAFNPILQLQYQKEQGNNEKLLLNTRGTYVRGIIGKKLGFQFYFTENQERLPGYANQYINTFKAVPGVGYYKRQQGYDYFDTRASLTWKVSRYVDMQLGHDKHFIGNGHRSLLLSDFGTTYNFLKVQTRYKKLFYQNIFAEFTAYNPSLGAGDKLYTRKYFRASYLNIGLSNWLDVGVFEGLMLGKTDQLSLKLFNPVIFTNVRRSKRYSIQDRSYAGIDMKANLPYRMQFYGQAMIDNISLRENRQWWGNRFGYQLGVKAVDVFNLRNVDVQAETNVVRPFTYAANDSIANYTHFNLPLAHPLGGNFKEYIFIVRAQPFPKLYVQAKLVHYKQGLDSAGLNYGSNPFVNTGIRVKDEIAIAAGNTATVSYGSFVISYEWKENLFFDAALIRRTSSTEIDDKTTTNIFSVGIRLNMGRREFDY